MRRNWVLTVLTLLIALAFISGCAKKTVLKESTTAPGKAAWEIKMEAMEKEKKAKEAEAKKATAKTAQPAKSAAPGKAAWEIKMEAMEKEKKAKEAETKKAAGAKGVAASPAKELYELTDIHFAYDKFSLTDEGRAFLDKHAAWLNKNKDVMVVIEGNCDERGTSEYNLALGERRADAAAKYLVSLGIDSKRIKTKSYGFERPLDPRHNEEAWAKNRRANFVVSSKLTMSSNKQ